MANRIGDILGLADPSEGHLLFDLSQVVDSRGGFHEPAAHLGFHQARGNDIDPG